MLRKYKHIVGGLSVVIQTKINNPKVLQLIFDHISMTKLGHKLCRRLTLTQLH
jgi:hypothetical protein